MQSPSKFGGFGGVLQALCSKILFQSQYDWSERKPRMWTTVFNEEEEKSDVDEPKYDRSSQDYEEADSTHPSVTNISRGQSF